MVKTELFYPFTKFNFVFSLCFCTLFYWPIQTTVTLCTSQGARINSKNNGFIMLHLLGNMLLSMRHFRQISDLMLNTIPWSFSLMERQTNRRHYSERQLAPSGIGVVSKKSPMDFRKHSSLHEYKCLEPHLMFSGSQATAFTSGCSSLDLQYETRAVLALGSYYFR